MERGEKSRDGTRGIIARRVLISNVKFTAVGTVQHVVRRLG